MKAVEILDLGLGMTLQDRGRPGWRRFGVPPGGAMDPHAAEWANRLLNNPSDAPLLELLVQGAKLRFLTDAWISITGADASPALPMWKTVRVCPMQELTFPRNRSGVWTYLAIEGGFSSVRWFGSASTNPRAKIGSPLRRGLVLHRQSDMPFVLPPAVASRSVAVSELLDYTDPAPFQIWPAPQWPHFSESARSRFLGQAWRISAQSDRVGYRLEGEPIEWPGGEIVSEPVRTGTVQIPTSGQPIVTMPDGPTVGGYPKIGWIAPHDLGRIAQCRPGQSIRFRPAIALGPSFGR